MVAMATDHGADPMLVSAAVTTPTAWPTGSVKKIVLSYFPSGTKNENLGGCCKERKKRSELSNIT
jgi:hypothetical protein